jgi:hypothetical protein
MQRDGPPQSNLPGGRVTCSRIHSLVTCWWLYCVFDPVCGGCCSDCSVVLMYEERVFKAPLPVVAYLLV